MVWLTEKKVFHHLLDLGFERVDIPIRVKFLFRLKDGYLDPGSLSKEILYNRAALQRRYPELDSFRLERSIQDKVEEEIQAYFRASGFLKQGHGGQEEFGDDTQGRSP